MKIDKNYYFFTTIFLMLLSSKVFASESDGFKCQEQQHLLNKTKELISFNNFLLGNIHSSIALSLNCSPHLTEAAHYSYAYTLTKLNENDLFWNEFNKARKIYPSNSYTMRRFNLLATITDSNFMPTLHPLDRSRFELWESRHKEEGEFQKLTKSSPLSDLELKKFTQFNHDLNDTPRKSPLIAGTLSAILPGAGHAYNGQWQAATVSLLFNTLFLASTIAFAKHKMVAPAFASGVVFSLTYAGNIFGAVDGAQKLNASYLKQKEEPFHREIFPDLYP